MSTERTPNSTHVMRYGFDDDLDYGAEPETEFYNSEHDAYEAQFSLPRYQTGWVLTIAEYDAL